ncbi:MAG TPA: hypothetical protein PK924_05850 [Bacilli bacterium]|nr:hypothetical protein [Bacilli bacterium]
MVNATKVKPTEGIFAGKLIYNDKAEFILDLGNGEYYNISDALKLVYFNQFDNRINIKIVHNGRIAFNEDGDLYLKVIAKPKLTSFFVLGEDLETKLFNLAGENIEIEIYARALRDKTNGTIDKK